MVDEPESRWVDIKGVNLHYLDWGDPKAPAVVLLHGARAHAHTWDPVRGLCSPSSARSRSTNVVMATAAAKVCPPGAGRR